VSLALVGASFLIRQGVENATLQWKGGIEFIVFMQPNITPAQRTALRDTLNHDPAIKRIKYVDQKEALAEFRKIFRDQPELLQSVDQDPSILPASFRVVPRNADATAVDQLKEIYEKKSGVYQVMASSDTIKTMQRLSGVLNTGLNIVAIVLFLASALLIFNTIQTAMFARRREIEVMKLVGATNWFIRIPFMIEGLVQGLLGALMAIGGVFFLNHLFRTRIANDPGVTLLKSFVVENSDVFTTCVIVGIAGVLVGVVSSAIAATWFLDV
jgi:cell division transport system permease protein